MFSSKKSSSKKSSSKKSSSKKSSSKKSSSKKSSSKPDYFAVFLAKFDLAMQDPDIPGPRHHHIIYVETQPSNQVGVKFHVVGDITRSAGMTYESRPFHNPQQSARYNSMEFLGYTAAKGFQRCWDEVLGGLPTPPKQKEYNAITNKTELVKSWHPLTFYGPGETQHHPWKCTEWTNDYAIPALYEAGLIIEEDDDDDDDDDEIAETGVGTSAESGDWVWDPACSRYRRWSEGTSCWVWAPEQ